MTDTLAKRLMVAQIVACNGFYPGDETDERIIDLRWNELPELPSLGGLTSKAEFRAMAAVIAPTNLKPVAWLVKRYANDGSWLRSSLYLNKPIIGSTARTDFIPLFEYPSPETSVKP